MAKRSRGKRRPKVERVRVVEGEDGRELIVDETFASLYRPGSAVTGLVWDAIAAPLLARPLARRRDVLILGLGGGSAARIIRALAPKARIVGVELDSAVIAAAREHFDLDALDVEVVIEDALTFLNRDRGRYDAIFEDVFVGAGDLVHKPGWLPEPGHRLAKERLRSGGVFVSNTLDEAPRVSQALLALFPTQVRIDVEDYDNRIFAAGEALPSARELRQAVADDPILSETLPRLTFRTVARAPGPNARPARRGSGVRAR